VTAAVERDIAAAAPQVSNPEGVSAAVPHVGLLLDEAHESIERLRGYHAAIEAIRADIEAEAAWLAGVFAAVERRPTNEQA
jgi:hypothetical protein